MLTHLDRYLEQFEAQARACGIQVHWARDAAAHNRIVHELLAARHVRRVVKSKSMLTEECGLNPYLEARGIKVVDTDLGERIMQLLRQPPSHIVTPAIHLRREEVARLFHEKLGVPENLTPDELVAVARRVLRQKFLEPKRPSRASTLPWPKPERSSSARTRATPIWACTWPRCTLPQWVSKSSSRAWSIWACFCGCWRAALPASPSRCTRRTSGGRVPARKCMWCWSITAEAVGWGCHASGRR